MAAVPGSAHAVERGERVFLRAPAAADRRVLLRVRRESERFLRPWEPVPPRGTAWAGPRWFASLLAKARSDDADAALVCRAEDGEPMGVIALSAIVRGAFHSGYLSYWIGERFARNGYMAEAGGLYLRRVFRALDLHRVEANLRPENEPSRALARRLGFRLEGSSPRYLKIAGRSCDHERWALLAEEWRGSWKRPPEGRRS